jgi:hypothetical protein
VDERECTRACGGGELCPNCIREGDPDGIYSVGICLWCGQAFFIGETGNELGFCVECSKSDDFPYDLDVYYRDHDAGKVAFKGFDTMERGLLEAYRR